LKKFKLEPPRDENLAAVFFCGNFGRALKLLDHYNGVTVYSSFVLRCYANVVIPLKPLLGPSMFGRGVAQPG
jgi:hypothetical protein